MLKFKTSSLLLSLTLLTAQAIAQTQPGQISLGVGIQNWSSSFSLPDTYKYRGDGHTGYTQLKNYTGGGVEASLRFKNPHFSLNIGLMTLSQTGGWQWNRYDPSSTTILDEVYNINFSENILEVPVSFKYDFTLTGLRPFLEAGGSFGLPSSRSILQTHTVVYQYAGHIDATGFTFTDGDYSVFGGAGVAKRLGRLDLQLYARHLWMQEYLIGTQINRTALQIGLTAIWVL